MPGRVALPFYSPVHAFEHGGLLGYGIGAAHQGAVSLVPDRPPGSWLGGRMFEDEPGRVMVELGPIGFTLVFVSRIMLIGLTFRQVRSVRHPFYRALAVSCLLFMLSQLVGGVVFNATGGVLFWWFGGVVFTLMRLDQQATRLACLPVAAVVPSPGRQVPPGAAAAQSRHWGPAGSREAWPRSS